MAWRWRRAGASSVPGSRAAAAAEHAELRAVGVAELDRAVREHAAMRAGGLGQRRPHLEALIVGKERTGHHGGSGRTLALHDHAARRAHETVRALAEDLPAGRRDLRHVVVAVHLGEERELVAPRIDRPPVPREQLRIAGARALLAFAPARAPGYGDSEPAAHEPFQTCDGI